MVAKLRNLKSIFNQTHSTSFENLLVSGCSYVWNNSEEHICTWPYYLRDIVGFKEVYDCSQSGGGPPHVFNSIINEIETNTAINPINTLIIVMWPELTRFDAIAHKRITKPWHFMSNYDFNHSFSTLSLFKNIQGEGDTSLHHLCGEYHKHIDGTAYENMIKVKALDAYLRDKQFTKVFLSWRTPFLEDLVPYLDPVEYLDNFTEKHNMRIPNDGHPTPDAHLQWTRTHLVPYLTTQEIIQPL